jgi:ribonuclease T
MTHNTSLIAKRFRGFLPVVLDLETSGFNAETDAILEIAAVFVTMDNDGLLKKSHTESQHLLPFPNANLDEKAMAFTGIKPYHPFRFAVEEKIGMTEIFKAIREEIKKTGCQRAVLVAHNAIFDMSFLTASSHRCALKNPFHPFTVFDTASLSALALGQTVLAKAAMLAKIPFDMNEAHSAIYDAERTADLFCFIINQWQMKGGWDPITQQPILVI